MNESEWKVVHLEYVCEKKGLVRGPFGGALKKEFFVQSGYKVYEQKNAIQKDEGIGEYFIDEEKFQELKRFEVNGGDFIISCSGTIGRIFRIPNNAPKGVINQALLKIRLDNRKINSEFFYQYFQWDTFQRKIIDNTQGGAMPNLVGMNIFRRTPIPLPTMNEQQKIASILSTWDKAIELKEKLIEQKKEQKKGLMQKLLTGEVRLPGFDGEWRKVRLEEISECLDNKRRPLNSTERERMRGNIPYYGANGIVDYVNDFIFDERLILLAEDGGHFNDFMNKPIAMRIDGKAWVNNHAHILRITGADFDFIYFSLVHKDIRKYINGTTRGKLTKSDMLSIELKLPIDIKEQMHISKLLSNVTTEIQLLDKEITELKQQKKGLMQLLLTGKVRVKV